MYRYPEITMYRYPEITMYRYPEITMYRYPEITKQNKYNTHTRETDKLLFGGIYPDFFCEYPIIF